MSLDNKTQNVKSSRIRYAIKAGQETERLKNDSRLQPNDGYEVAMLPNIQNNIAILVILYTLLTLSLINLIKVNKVN